MANRTLSVTVFQGSVDSSWNTSPTRRSGPVTTRLREELIAIQYGHHPDPFTWIHKVC